MERADLQDTSPEMHRKYVELMREKGPEWRVQRTFELMQWSIDMFPEQTKKAILLKREKKGLPAI
ncbi:MAG TPA: hypothetical protein VGL56_07185 [Fimbriimonadaceae bacterium]|jgi:hypothetical protein